MQGNCTDTTPPILGRPLEPPLDTAGGQCLLIIREDGLETAGGDSALVLHNLYFARFTQDVGGGAPFSTLVVARGGALRLSQTVLSGDGSAGRGLHVEAADVVASGALRDRQCWHLAALVHSGRVRARARHAAVS